ncbi:unnamed protein product [Lasius platythorax]|uniref:Uncharacterized protein n=1 Tax=Lasius platythorax TaxID=488582 RepID=A0AAV2NZ55_9HYME
MTRLFASTMVKFEFVCGRLMEPQEFQLQIPVNFDTEGNDEPPRRALFKHRREPASSNILVSQTCAKFE